MEEQVVQRTNKVGVGVDVFCAHAGCVAIQKHSANLPSKASGRKNVPSKPHCRTPFFQKRNIQFPSVYNYNYMWCIYIYVDLFQKMTISFCFQTIHPFGIWQPNPPKPPVDLTVDSEVTEFPQGQGALHHVLGFVQCARRSLQPRSKNNELKMGTYKINHSNMDWQGINYDQSINLIEFLDSIYSKNRLRSKGRKKIAPLAAKKSRSLKMNTLAMAIPTFLWRNIPKEDALIAAQGQIKLIPFPKMLRGVEG